MEPHFPENEHNWLPANYLTASVGHDVYSLVVLNQPIDDVELFQELCKNARLVVAADGAANRMRDLGLEDAQCIPHAIVGDLDSLRQDVREYYENLGVTIIRDKSQYDHDLGKALSHVSSQVQAITQTCREERRHWPANWQNINHTTVIFGGLGGRIDHAFAIFNQLWKCSDGTMNCGDIYLMAPNSIAFVLMPGKNTILTPVSRGLLSESIGIIPIGHPAIITTEGLEWDIENWHTEMGGQVSTSNHIKKPIVDVYTTERVLFTVEIARTAS